MILFRNQLGSFMKASFLSFITGDGICSETEWEFSLLHGYGEKIISDQFSWKQIREDLRLQRGKDAGWLEGDRGQRLKHMLFFALRHKDHRKYDICNRAIHCSLEKGVESVVDKRSREGMALYRLYRAVWGEIHSMCGFLRFTPLGNELLVTKACLEHHTVDFLLMHFRQRYPKHILVLLHDRWAYILDEEDAIHKVHGEPFEKMIDEDQFLHYWETYYKAQYIQTRKNIALTARVIRKKYWNWLYEGRIIMEEERGTKEI